MRTSIWLGTLVLGLALGGAASAATFAGYGGTPPPGMSTTPPQGAPGLSLGSYIRNTFSLSRVFRSFPIYSRTQQSFPASIPDPNSPEYLQAFGFRRLGR
jgi:hypothetical protein